MSDADKWEYTIFYWILELAHTMLGIETYFSNVIKKTNLICITIVNF